MAPTVELFPLLETIIKELDQLAEQAFSSSAVIEIHKKLIERKPEIQEFIIRVKKLEPDIADTVSKEYEQLLQLTKEPSDNKLLETYFRSSAKGFRRIKEVLSKEFIEKITQATQAANAKEAASKRNQAYAAELSAYNALRKAQTAKGVETQANPKKAGERMTNNEIPKAADAPDWNNLISQEARNEYGPFAENLKELAEMIEKALTILRDCFDTGKGWPDEKKTKIQILCSAINLKQKLELIIGPESAAAFYRELELGLLAVMPRPDWDISSDLHIGVDSQYAVYIPGDQIYTYKESCQIGAMQEMERIIIILKEWHERLNASSRTNNENQARIEEVLAIVKANLQPTTDTGTQPAFVNEQPKMNISNTDLSTLKIILSAIEEWKIIADKYGPESEKAKQLGSKAVELLCQHVKLLDDFQLRFGASVITQRTLAFLADKVNSVPPAKRFSYFYDYETYCEENFIADLKRWIKEASTKQAGITSEAQEPQPKNYIRKGSIWHICFEGETVSINGDLKGLPLIAYLLQNPQKTISAFDLEQAIIKRPSGKAMDISALDGALADEENDVPGLIITDTGETINSRALAKVNVNQLRALIDTLKEKRDKTENENETEELDTQIDVLEKELKKKTNRWGKPRPIEGDQSEKARVRVTQKIDRVKKILLKDHKKLYDHLDLCLKIGAECSYTPENLPNWQFF